MMSLLLMRVTTSAKAEVKIVLGSLLVIVFLPVMAVFIIARTSILTLAQSAGDMLYEGPLSKTDTYDWGNCTYWAALLRQQAGKPIPNTWGNAATWAFRARLGGYLVDHTPAPTAIMQISDVANGLGHVAYVEYTNPTDGSWTISEMNVKGFDIVDAQTLSASAAKDYSFIHDKDPSL